MYMSIKTFKVKHGKNFDELLEKACLVAVFALKQKLEDKKSPTSKDVKAIGLKSEISNQILRKYYLNKKLKSVKKASVKLTVPGQYLKLHKNIKNVYVTCLKTTLNFWCDTAEIQKINQIEFDKTYAYISCSFEALPETQEPETWIGIDLNSTSHSIVLANQKTGKVKKYGKQIPHIQQKYKKIRKHLQSKGVFSLHEKLKHRATNKVNDQLHKITKAIVAEAKETGCGIKLENLKGISKKKTKKHHKESNFTLNSWPFFKFKQLLTYKAILSGVSVIEICPAGTSQNCSRCGLKGNRDRKLFRCEQQSCEHVDHADVNAAFNIALAPKINPVKNEINRRGNKASASQKPVVSPNGESFESKLAVEL